MPSSKELEGRTGPPKEIKLPWLMELGSYVSHLYNNEYFREHLYLTDYYQFDIKYVIRLMQDGSHRAHECLHILPIFF